MNFNIKLNHPTSGFHFLKYIKNPFSKLKNMKICDARSYIFNIKNL